MTTMRALYGVFVTTWIVLVSLVNAQDSVLGTVAPATAQDCVIGNATVYDGQLSYLVGQHRIAGSMYASCANGKATCFQDEGISDAPQAKEISCQRIVEKQQQRQLSVHLPQDFMRWPEAVVCYEMNMTMDETQLEMLSHAMQSYQMLTGIDFVAFQDCRDRFGLNTRVCNNCQARAMIQDSTPGCWAQIGYYGWNREHFRQKVNFGENCHTVGIYLHELGHILGLRHEHGHPERKVIVIKHDLKVEATNYMRDAPEKVRATEYDMRSIMHYPGGKELCIPKDPTLRYCDVHESAQHDNCIEPDFVKHCNQAYKELIGSAGQLTPNDIAAIKAMYTVELANRTIPFNELQPHKVRATAASKRGHQIKFY